MVELVSLEGGPMKKAIGQSIQCATLAAVLMIALGALPHSRSAFADQVPAGWEASNMKPIGYSDLNGHGAFKMAIKRVGDKWYLYMGHLWERGWTIVDVTDPVNPKVAKHIPGPDNTFTIQMELHDNLMVTAMERMFPTWGGDVDKPFDEGVLVWDISDPLNPKQLSHWKTGSTGAHRIGYPGGKYVNVAAAMPGYKGNILVFLGPAIIDGNTAYLGYGPAIVILDISDITQPRQIGRLDMSPPFLLAGQQGVHDVLKIPGKPLLFSHSETSAENCDTDPLDHVAMIDIKNPNKPRLMSMFPLPVPPV